MNTYNKQIIFSEEMINALLEGRKTQTRRVIKKQPAKGYSVVGYTRESSIPSQCRAFVWEKDDDSPAFFSKNPYDPTIVVGGSHTLLWVRETWRTLKIYDHIKPSLLHPESPIQYAATDDFSVNEDEKWGKSRPSIFMPKFASRIDLRVHSVSAERIQGISDDDALCEGVEKAKNPNCIGFRSYQPNHALYRTSSASFRSLWVSINGEDSWKENPWVWVITFSVENKSDK